METYICSTTAMEYWRANRRPLPFGASTPDRAEALPPVSSPDALRRFPLSDAPSSLSVADISARGFFTPSSPVHVMVPSNAHCRSIKGVVCHVCSTPLPEGSFVEVSHNLYVATPELAFVQLATLLPFAEALKAGYELCGSYSLQTPNSATQYKMRPLTNIRLLETYLDKLKGYKGSAKARQILACVRDKSASPRETDATLLLCLPIRRGGFGIEFPLLNQRIDVKQRARKASDSMFYIGDLYWPQHKFVVEYDSDEFHRIRPSIARDAERRNALSYMGITVVTVTNEQVKDDRAFEKVAHIVAKATNHRIRERPTRYNPLAARAQLREAILGPSHTIGSDSFH